MLAQSYASKAAYKAAFVIYTHHIRHQKKNNYTSKNSQNIPLAKLVLIIIISDRNSLTHQA